MNRKFFTFVLVILVSVLGTVTGYGAEVSFADTSGHWAEEAIASVVEKGLFNGTGDNHFSPDISMDRGMFVTVLGRFAEKMGADVNGASDFQDVPQDAYYAQYVGWAADHGIVKGTSETTFSPAQSVTREQMCTLFIRLLDYAKYDVPAPEGALAFVDESEISGYAKETVMSAASLGLIQGMETENGMAFCPKDSATRAQVATVFLRLDGLEGIYGILNTKEDPAPSGQDPVTPITEPPAPGSSGTSGSSGPSAEPTTDEKDLEQKVAGYLETMLENYDNMTYLSSTDQIVRDCMKIITDCMRDAQSARANGAFLSKEYINTHYSEQMENAKTIYKGMSDEQKNQMNNVAFRMETIAHLRTVLEYFGFGGLL